MTRIFGSCRLCCQWKMCWDLVELACQALLRMPEVVGLLHSHPDASPVAAKLSQTDSHLRSHSGFAGQNTMQSLTRHPQLSRRFAYGKFQ